MSDADGQWEVEDDGRGEDIPSACEFEQRFSVFWLDVRGVDHGRATDFESFVDDCVKQFESRLGDRLVALVIADEGTALVARHDLGGREVLAGKGRLARTGRAAQHDESEFGYLDVGKSLSHRRNTAICVGGPPTGSSGPMLLIS